MDNLSPFEQEVVRLRRRPNYQNPRDIAARFGTTAKEISKIVAKATKLDGISVPQQRKEDAIRLHNEGTPIDVIAFLLNMTEWNAWYLTKDLPPVQPLSFEERVRRAQEEKEEEEEKVEYLELPEILDAKALQKIISENFVNYRAINPEDVPRVVAALNELVALESWIIKTTDSQLQEEIFSVTNEFIPAIVRRLTLPRSPAEEEKDQIGSDKIATFSYNPEIILASLEKRTSKRVRNREGEFFYGINQTSIDLSRYQIYSGEQVLDMLNEEKKPGKKKKKNKRTHCLIHACMLQGVSIRELHPVLKLSRAVKTEELTKVSRACGRPIHLTFTAKEDKFETKWYGDRTLQTEPIKLFLYKGHYFVNETMNITTYAATNYLSVCHLKDFHLIVGFKKDGKPRREKARATANSGVVVRALDRQGLLPYSPELMFFDEFDTNYPSLEFVEYESREFTPKDGTASLCLVYADLENFVYKKPNHKPGDPIVHTPMMIGCAIGDDYNVFMCDKNPQIGVSSWIKWVAEKTSEFGGATIVMHNLKYDMSILKPYLNMTSILESDGNVYSASVWHGKQKMYISFRDSYKFLQFPLSKFKKNLGLTRGKREAINYEYYTHENLYKPAKVEEYIKDFTDEEKEIFFENASVKDGYFNALKYYKPYLKDDVLVLQEGFEKFLKMTETIESSFPARDCLTISSWADKLMISRGAYEGVYENFGCLRDHIQQGIYGGRVHAIPGIYTNPIIDDDGVSLYPSSIVRICEVYGGLPTGPAKVLKDVSKWREPDFGIVTVRILAVNKHQQIPFIPNRGEETIEYVNSAPDQEIVVWNKELESWEKWHKIDFEVLNCVYWDGKPNPRMGEIIKELFEKRKIEKKKPNGGTQLVYKLAMNSCYGKTCEKLHRTREVIYKINVNKKDEKVAHPTEYRDVHYLEVDPNLNTPEKRRIHNEEILLTDYLVKNKHTVEKVRKLRSGDDWRPAMYQVRKSCMDDSGSRNHIAVFILGQARIAMNEVLGLANEIGVQVYYTDTDSIHMEKAGVDRLAKAYKVEYGREMHGNELGQFHPDFPEGTHASTTIILGKKAYANQLSNGTTNARLKGIPPTSIKFEADKVGGVIPLYKKMTQEPVRFLLNPEGKVRFKTECTFTYTYDKPCYRLVDFS